MLMGLGGKIMTYDGENRPLSVTWLGKKTCYVYVVDGKRLKKVENLAPAANCNALPTNAAATVYFGAVEVRSWMVAGQEQVLTYPLSAIKLLNGTTPAVASYLHRDGLSSVRAITNAAGAKIEAALYKPFGEQSEWVLPGNAAPETKGWIGERYDADAGLQYLNARYYDPELSLFLQPDWVEVTKAGVGTNRFSYSFNDPVNLSDPNGNCLWDGCIVEGAIAIGLGVLLGDAAVDAANGPVVGDSPLGNPVGRANLALAEAAAPHAGTLENLAMTTPTALDDVAAGLVSGWAKISVYGARGSTRAEIAYMQTTYDEVFSATGRKIHSETAGVKIRTIDDLADAIRSGQVAPEKIAVNYVERDGVRVVADTRTSIALERAGVDPAEWNWVNKTGDDVIEDNVNKALQRNDLDEPTRTKPDKKE